MSNIVRIKVKKGNMKAKMDDADDLSPDLVDPAEGFKNELETHFQKGFEEGFNQGVSETEKKFTQELIEKQQEFYKILSSFDEQMAEMERSFGMVVTQVAKMMTEKIIKIKIENSDIIFENLEESFKKIIGANEVYVKINPADYQKIEAGDELNSLTKNFTKIKFEQNPNIEVGGCLIETDIGNVDARIATQINEIVKQIELSLNDQEEK